MLWVILGGIAALSLIGGGAVAVYNATRGLRNNNPGNIVISNTSWLGKKSPNTDGHFEQFDTPEHGIRALAKILKNYQEKDGIVTIDGIIRRWSATDQDAYVRNVANALGVGVFDEVDMTDLGTLTTVTKAIIKQENGVNPYPDSVLNAGVAMT